MKRAAQFAAHAHRGQLRKDGRTPYINHPVRVAMYLKRFGVTDPEILQAALLHDVIEDTQYSAADINAQFGERVAALVQEVTDDKTLHKGERKLAQLTATYSYGAACIKVADKMANMRDILEAPPPWPTNRKKAYFEHAGILIYRLWIENKVPSKLVHCAGLIMKTGLESGFAAAPAAA